MNQEEPNPAGALLAPPPSAFYRQVSSPKLVNSVDSSSALNLRRRKINIEVVDHGPKGPTWQFPGFGTSEHVQVPQNELADIQLELNKPHKYLGELPATAICGNDILSSVLYSASSVAAKSGKLMPIPLLMVSAVLFSFRFIYEEVVTAIPLNGGTYNALLNTTSKRTAAVAACLSILSYVATGVVSATSGVRYLNNQVEIPIVGCTIILLGAFALLAAMGTAESSRVAVVIFLHHIIVLSILFVSCIIYGVQHSHIFSDNMHTELPEVDFAELPEVDFAGSMLDGNVFTSIFFGFGASMLGITGFESSSNYVEEQAPGVFRKTLRNMWALVTFFNIGLGAGILAVLPLGGDDGIYEHGDALLAKVGQVAVGSWFETWVCVDAFVVLCGAVLTSYVGICGLVQRLASDRVLPAFLAKKNKLRGTNHYIIGIYFLLSSSLVLILNADATTVNGVYTYAFLGLMAMFACACMLLKGKRSEIPRDIHASWVVVIAGFLLVVVGIFSNLLGDPTVLMYFAIYFIVVMLVIFIMFERVTILRVILVFLQSVAPSRVGKQAFSGMAEDGTPEVEHTGARGGRTIARTIVSIRNAPIVFFCKVPDLTIINKAIIYVRRNEQTHTLRIVHVFADEEADAPILATFREMAALFDSMYPKIRVDFVSVHGEFGPAMIEWLSRSMNVPRNMMFITQPDILSAERVSTAGQFQCRRRYELSSCVVGLLGIALMLVENEIVERREKISTNSELVLLVLKSFVLALTVLLDILLVLRYRCDGRVHQLQSAVPSKRTKFSLWRPLLLLLELLVCSFHIPPGVGGKFEIVQLHGTPSLENESVCVSLQRGIETVKRGDSCYLVYQYPVEVLGVFMVVRLYLLARFVRSSSGLHSPWVALVGSLNGVDAMKPFFHFKTIFKLHPLRILLPLIVLITSLTAAVVRVVERPVQAAFDNYWKSVWFTIVTLVRTCLKSVI
ncbi:Transmembrane protein [Phytophthora palmivora]|uniref:Transmembrane protein n=1 Tax=Phytophthora palmivora TaxID=4796 RepID=A0A2P4XZX1_9STRA|nr:Transmembrane protein [Phytophthora palmivora]